MRLTFLITHSRTKNFQSWNSLLRSVFLLREEETKVPQSVLQKLRKQLAIKHNIIKRDKRPSYLVTNEGFQE